MKWIYDLCSGKGGDDEAGRKKPRPIVDTPQVAVVVVVVVVVDWDEGLVLLDTHNCFDSVPLGIQNY